MTNNPLACRLIRASTLSYDLNGGGTGFGEDAATTALIAATGITAETACVHQVGFDAVYYADTTDGAGILAFRGTLPPTVAFGSPESFLDVVLDWLNDGNASLVLGRDLPGRVHCGFLDSLDRLWPAIDGFDLPRRLAGKPLHVTGHSKGGALAQMAAYRLARAGIVPASVQTFAAPRSGNEDFAKAFDTVLPGALRFEYRDDLVPHLPPRTAAWANILVGLRKLHSLFPAEAPHLAGSPAAGIKLDKLLSRIEAFNASYVSAGTLRFIDWSTPPALQEASLTLDRQRNLRLATALLEFRLQEVVEDHFATNGYTLWPCG